MTLAKKGTRKITVNDRVFLWRVSTKSDYLSLTIQAEEGHLLFFSMPFISEWLRLGLNPEEKESLPENEIQVITPSFIKEIIDFGLSNSWMLQDKNHPYRMTFIDGKFKRVT